MILTRQILKKKEFSSSQVKELEEFYGRSFFYKYLVSIVPTVLSITDLADLWYREFYLELSRRLQFPIEMSLPWILTDHILESRDAAMMESVLYPLGILAVVSCVFASVGFNLTCIRYLQRCCAPCSGKAWYTFPL